MMMSVKMFWWSLFGLLMFFVALFLFSYAQTDVTLAEADAQCNLGTTDEEGQDGVHDAVEAVKRYRMLAEQGDARAQYLLGRAYETGQGAPLYIPDAVKWYEKAAKQGYLDAQYALACCYATFAEVYDTSSAKKWLAQAVEQGHPQAREKLEKINNEWAIVRFCRFCLAAWYVNPTNFNVAIMLACILALPALCIIAGIIEFFRERF